MRNQNKKRIPNNLFRVAKLIKLDTIPSFL